MFIEKQGDYLLIELEGEVDSYVCKMIKPEIDEKIREENAKNLIFDLRKTSFMDSSGIGMILGRYKNASERGGNVYVTNVNEQIEKIFNISGMYKLIKKIDNKESLTGNV